MKWMTPPCPAHNSGKEANPLKKAMMVLLCIAMAGMVLSGCAAGNASGTTATAAPIVTNSPMPTASAQTDMTTMAPEMNGNTAGTMTGVPGVTDSTGAADMTGTNGMTATGGTTGMTAAGASGMTAAQAGRTAEKIEEAVERLSEVDDAEVVLDGDSRVLVAVEFDDQYSAGLDERMKKMIVDAVKKVDDGLTDIEITDDSTLYGQVKGLGERLAKATGFDELANDFGDLWNRITGM